MGKKASKGSEGAVGGKAVNNVINILLAIGCLTILFPLYMTIVIAFKKPSEMTNDVAGALGFPASWSFSNFAEAMRVTDFWRSLGNSLLLTGVTVVICILLHSLAGYVIGRKMAKLKLFKASYFYIVSGMFVPFAVLMMPLVKQTSQLGIANRFGVIVLYVNEHPAVFRVFEKYPNCAGRGGMRGRGRCLADILENYFPKHEANACDCGSFDRHEYLERCNDPVGYYVWQQREYTSVGTVELPVTVWNKL